LILALCIAFIFYLDIFNYNNKALFLFPLAKTGINKKIHFFLLIITFAIFEFFKMNMGLLNPYISESG